MAALVCVDPGPLATIQDPGRFGWQRHGISTAGAMDTVALRLANALVGNPGESAGIELTMTGGAWRCEAESCRIAVAGGAFAITVDGERVAPWRSFLLRDGETLRIGAASDAVRAYLAVAGGFAVPPQLGSVATHVRWGLGGLDGGALRPGSAVPLRRESAPEDGDLALDPRLLPPRPGAIRVVLGPQRDFFAAAARAVFLESEYHVTNEADRMGLKLAGPAIEHEGGFNIVSDAIAPGSIQVPGSRQPIVLLADRQTTGGYPKIATAIGADLPTLGQLRPGDALRFAAISVAAARAARSEAETAIAHAIGSIAPLSAGLASDRLLALNLIDGVIDAHA